jgi:uncharacterized protein (DUF1800 family)
MMRPTDPWAPYEPTATDSWDLGKVAHLHRRAGFGATWAELQRDLKDGPAASVERLFRPRDLTSTERQDRDGLRQGMLSSSDDERLKAYWLYEILYGPDPLREKLTLFWHGHFATSNRKVQSVSLMLAQNELLRRHALCSFRELLNGICTDPAMLVWLDGAGSRKEKPNENFAREFLELFTVGLGHYTEKDIREAARAFTGWTREDGSGRFRLIPAKSDLGAKTFLKQTGPWQPADIVRITLEQPAAAEFLCRKLYRFFVSESSEPSAELIRPLAAEFRGHDYSIQHVVTILLRSQHFYARAARRQRIKNPVEFSIGLLRTLEVPAVRLLAAAVACEQQGMDLFYPPTVKGWDGGRSWLNSSTVLERGNWVADVLWGNSDLGLESYNPLAWTRGQGIKTEKAAQALVELLLQQDIGPRSRAAVLEAAKNAQPDDLRKALQLVLHCPEYQLA